jgi:hypothetical protein
MAMVLTTNSPLGTKSCLEILEWGAQVSFNELFSLLELRIAQPQFWDCY